MQNSRFWDYVYIWCAAMYALSWFLPACYIILPLDENESIFMGYQCAFAGIAALGFAIPAHISVFGGLLQRINMNHPESPDSSWAKFSILAATIGVSIWLLGANTLLVGYYLWAFSTVGMAISYYFFRYYKSEELKGFEE